MQAKIICILYFLLTGVLYAQTDRSETPESITYKVRDSSFEEVQLRLSNELQVNAFTIVYQINIAKALDGVAKSLEKQPLLKKGVSIGFCKPSTSYTLLEKSADALLYCPFKILIVETKDSQEVIISFLKAPRISTHIDPKELDAMIETIITSALD
ncbi:MAG: DUF302 domain-containing protein [Sulfuricurvum sp.]|uniref:DUF302 domain-containing protein n=1 Tax=Sulfuricurvum sp. TaxID=2025608 RepID=UPI0026241EDE|nr:DUF302 domain-containing protein [Sulfuricurvum sp.]MDD2368022.1 DUF302 domain-containing protein [Sulfuricurvum sp.]MDD5119510.1 DUF302 domain-containing protein [Sulfuricurvum sp.]